MRILRHQATFFEKAFGVPETSYKKTQAWLRAHAAEMSDAVGRRGCFFETKVDGGVTYGLQAGAFETPSVAELRASAKAASDRLAAGSAAVSFHPAQVHFRHVVEDVRALHARPDFNGAVFQATSQFNCLEMSDQFITPEQGISRYAADKTQGPACACCCPGGTAYRNYLLPLPGGETGQSRTRQLNTLLGVEAVFGERPWQLVNGYLESTPPRLENVNARLRDPAFRGAVEAALRIGVQWGTEVVPEDWVAQPAKAPRQLVTQAYCATVPVGYSDCPAALWEPLARCILRATYEATLLVGVVEAVRRQEQGLPVQPVVLTKVGGGVFANDPSWIVDAIQTARAAVREYRVPLALQLVHHGRLDAQYDILSEREE